MQSSSSSTDPQISRFLIFIQSHYPFFGVLAYHARYRFTDQIETAATDGYTVYVNPDFLHQLKREEQRGVLLHEVLHAALKHVSRRRERNPEVWNIAADIVVNGILAAQKELALPKGAIRDPELEKYSVEEIYTLLLNQPRPLLRFPDLISSLEGAPTVDIPELEEYWTRIVEKARWLKPGSIPAGMARAYGEITGPQVDWRTALWQFLTPIPIDYQEFDRRFIYQGLYLETLSGQSATIYVCIDTSGSINKQQLTLFMTELKGILRAYPHLKGNLYFADARLHGPYPLDSSSTELPDPVGGGGTNFIPFFEAVEAESSARDLAVYLTDGYGYFPSEPPSLSTLWVVSSGGQKLEHFPFGECVRLSC